MTIVILFYCNGFCKVTGLINITPFGYSNMVCKELQRDYRQQRDKALLSCRNLKEHIRQGTDILITLRDYADYPTLTGLHLLYITQDLVIVAAMRSNGYNRHLLINQCNRAVFHLGCRIALSMYV